MYLLYEIEEWIGVDPSQVYGGNVDDAVKRALRETLEGQVDEDLGIIVAVIEAETRGEGLILPMSGDPNIYLRVRYKVLAYQPVLLEVVRGTVREAREHGIFVGLGPIDGFVFKNQIMDEPVEYIPDRKGFRGLETGRIVELDDVVRARIVQISKLPRRTVGLRIGMTMRQPYLGKEEWLKEEAGEKATQV